MARISTGTNISSLMAQRLLQQAEVSFLRSLERLSTGMRINHASDDAAGLAVASSLEAKSRIYGAGIRNVNDGISTLNVAAGGLSQLSTLVTRMKELATQAANGSYSARQRQSLNGEANALVAEYNRITQTTTFNGRSLLSGTFGTLHIQAGQGPGSGLDFGIGSAISTSTTTSTTSGGDYALGSFTSFGAPTTGISVGNGGAIADGFNYFVETENTNKPTIMVIKSDGTLEAGSAPTLSFSADQSRIADFNGDGYADILFYKTGSKTMQVAQGEGTGKVTTRASFSGANTSATDVQVGDYNKDGVVDLVILDGGTSITMLHGMGDGTFKSAGTVATLAGAVTANMVVRDLDHDGYDDFVVGTGNKGWVGVYQNDTAGGFSLASTIAVSDYALNSLAMADLNNDGNDDLVYLNSNGDVYAHSQASTLNFGAPSFTTTLKSGSALRIGDVNGDGALDIVGTQSHEIAVLLSNGGFSFKTAQNFAGVGDPATLELFDINQDGLMDVFTGGTSGQGYGWALSTVTQATTTNTTTTTSQISNLDLTTQTGARTALTVLDALLNNINTEVGNIGSAQSRLQIAANLLSATKLNYDSARSRIMDADIAFESANLMRQRILQQTGAAVLAQANLQPQLVLSLLGRA